MAAIRRQSKSQKAKRRQPKSVEETRLSKNLNNEIYSEFEEEIPEVTIRGIRDLVNLKRKKAEEAKSKRMTSTPNPVQGLDAEDTISEFSFSVHDSDLMSFEFDDTDNDPD